MWKNATRKSSLEVLPFVPDGDSLIETREEGKVENGRPKCSLVVEQVA